jgi:hypothetical protein
VSGCGVMVDGFTLGFLAAVAGIALACLVAR